MRQPLSPNIESVYLLLYWHCPLVNFHPNTYVATVEYRDDSDGAARVSGSLEVARGTVTAADTATASQRHDTNGACHSHLQK